MRRPPTGAISAVLSAAGFGLLLWLGVSVALAPPGAGMAALRAPQMWALILAMALLATAAALALASRGGPRTPAELFRAPTVWHRRRNILVLIAVVLATTTGVLLSPGVGGAGQALGLGFAGMSLAAASLGAVAAGAVADALPPPPSPLPPLAVPARLLAGLVTGLALMFALLSGLLAVGQGGSRMLTILLLLGMLAAVTLWLDRRRADGQGRIAATAGQALLSVLLLAGVPAIALGMAATGLGHATIWLWIVALATLAGALAGSTGGRSGSAAGN